MALRELRMDDAAEPSVLECNKVTLQRYITMLHYYVTLLCYITITRCYNVQCCTVV